MAHVKVNPDAVSDISQRIASSGQQTSPTPAPLTPAASDPVSIAVAQTFAGRIAAVKAYTAAAGAITDTRAAMVAASGAAYQTQEAVNASAVGSGAAPATATPHLPAGAVPTLPTPSVPPPAIGAPPASGKAIATLIHSGPGPAGLHTAAAAMRRHSDHLRATAEQLRAQANSLRGDWNSAAGDQASSRIGELGSWYDTHAQHAASLAAAIDTHGEDFGRARNAVPPPEEFAEVERRLQMAVAANQAPGSLGRYLPVIAALQTQLASLNGQAVSGYADYAATAATKSVTGDPLEAPPHPGVQAAGFDVPLSPATADPPHGKDPRYWIDVSKIIHVPDGQLAPTNTVQIGPGLYYPAPGSDLHVTPPPPPSKYPLDIGDITSTAPGQLGPSGHVEIARTPDGTYWAPDPGGYQPSPPWSPPQRPIDVRDVIEVPEGVLAPWGYIEYLPGWWVPGPQLTSPGPR